MIKLAGAILIIMATGMYGFELAKDLITRISNLKEWKKIITILEGEIKFNNTILVEAIRRIGIRNQSIYSKFFVKMTEEMDKNKSSHIKEIWNKSVDKELAGKHSLKNSDILKIKEFVNVISNVNTQNVDKLFAGYMTEWELEIEELSKEKENKVKLYKTLGIMSGLFVAVLII